MQYTAVSLDLYAVVTGLWDGAETSCNRLLLILLHICSKSIDSPDIDNVTTSLYGRTTTISSPEMSLDDVMIYQHACKVFRKQPNLQPLQYTQLLYYTPCWYVPIVLHSCSASSVYVFVIPHLKVVSTNIYPVAVVRPSPFAIAIPLQ